MKIGAQFYSIRDKATTPEEIRRSFKAMKDIGYEIAQMSGIGEISAEELRDISLEYNMPITCTHISPPLLRENTDKYIREHKIYGCPVIGIGSMPGEYRGSVEGIRAFIKDFSEVAKKLNDAGLKFAYHNHDFEFVDLGGVIGYDLLIEEFQDLSFILDTYWVKYAGYDNLDYIKKLGKDRLQNVHFKDMKTEPQGEICPCGVGVIDFAPIVKLCNKLNIPHALVEQDNAPDLGDSYAQMGTSYSNLAHLFK